MFIYVEIKKIPPLVMSMTDIMSEKYSRVHSRGKYLPGFPARPEMNFYPKPKEFRSSKLLATNPYYQEIHHSPFFLRNSYCLLLLSLKKKNFPSPRRWEIGVKNPIKEQ